MPSNCHSWNFFFYYFFFLLKRPFQGWCYVGSQSWLRATFSQTKQVTLKFRINAFIPGQYRESLAQTFMPSTPWWAECKQHSTFPLGYLGTFLSSINTKSLSFLCPGFHVPWENIWKEILVWLHHFYPMPECGQVTWQSYHCHSLKSC